MDELSYRQMEPGEEKSVCALVRLVFTELVAPDYEQAGIEEFFRFANPAAMQARVRAGGVVLVAATCHGLAGMLEFAPPDRIAMLFVSQRHRGIAKELLARILEHVRTANPAVSKVTVHSSPYAEPVYRHMGFTPVGGMITENGIMYIHMELDLGSSGSSA